MGKAEALGDKVFHAIHVDNDRLDTVDKMTAMLSRYGVDRKQFAETFDSFAVRTKMRRAAQVSEAYGVDGVKRWRSTEYYLAQHGRLEPTSLRVMDWLIAQGGRPAGRPAGMRSSSIGASSGIGEALAREPPGGFRT